MKFFKKTNKTKQKTKTKPKTKNKTKQKKKKNTLCLDIKWSAPYEKFKFFRNRPSRSKVTITEVKVSHFRAEQTAH